jgi:hypothetical protein
LVVGFAVARVAIGDESCGSCAVFGQATDNCPVWGVETFGVGDVAGSDRPGAETGFPAGCGVGDELAVALAKRGWVGLVSNMDQFFRR